LILYVPLDTIRDYLFARDAGRLVADGLGRLRLEELQTAVTPAVVKILASQQTATVAAVLTQLRWISKRPLRVIVAVSPDSDRHARDLRVMSSVWPELDRHPVASLSEGMRSVLTGILELAGQGRLGIGAFHDRSASVPNAAASLNSPEVRLHLRCEPLPAPLSGVCDEHRPELP
jgi:UDP-glucose 4-epimerase